MNIVVRPVTTRRDRKLFLEYPWQLYAGDPNFIPPLRQNQKEMVGFARSHFYDTAESQTFLAFRDGVVCGRVAAILNHAHNKFQNENRGFFGFFESVDDQQVADALLDAVRDWFSRRGITQLRGPTNPSLNHECGLLIDGFHLPPTFMMTYNPPYYARLLETYGFRKAQDLFAFSGTVDMLGGLDKKLDFIATESAERFNVRVRPINKARFRAEIETFLGLYNLSLQSTWGFVPISAPEIKQMSASMKHLIIPELALIAEVDGKPIGAIFGLPDYNPRIREIDGRLFPFGIFKLLSRAPQVQTIPRHQRQCRAGISDVGSRTGVDEGPSSARARLGNPRGRVLLGAGVESSVAQRPGKGRSVAGEDVSALRLCGNEWQLKVPPKSPSQRQPS